MKTKSCSKAKKIAAYSTVAGMITISAFVNHTSKEVDANSIAANKVEQTLNSECFSSELFKSELDMKQTNGLTKIELIHLIRSSKTNIELEMYKSWKNTVGYTYASGDKIWMNRKFHDSFSECQKASNIGHELTHKLGMTHDLKVTKRRPFSVPYIVGSIIQKCCHD